MLPRENRLKRMKDFEILFKEGKFFDDMFLSAKVWKINEEKYPKRKYSKEDLRIGFVVGLKVSKKAVVRNRIKRKMREVVRLLLKDEKLKSGYMVAIIAKQSAIEKEMNEIEKSIKNILKKSGVLKN
jgi:ribonuclease P protein component